MSDASRDTELPDDFVRELDFLFEAGYLKRLSRSGWLLSGITDGESVAEHVYRTAIVGFVLACLEDADPYKTAVICLFHDIQEARVSDLNPLTKRYFEQDPAEEEARKDLCRSLNDRLSSRLNEIFAQYSEMNSAEAVIARDADLLECILQAYEYKERGHHGADNFIRGEASLQSSLKTKSASRLAALAENRSSAEWWKLLTSKT